MNAIAGGVLLQAESAPFDPSFFLMMGSIFLIFYLLVIRPESQKRKQHEAAIAAAEKGDTVVTTGGLAPLEHGSGFTVPHATHQVSFSRSLCAHKKILAGSQ